jgi:hypothetical protein
MSPPSSGSSKPNERLRHSLTSLLHVGFLLGLLFNPEDGGDIFPEDTTRHKRRCEILQSYVGYYVLIPYFKTRSSGKN